MMTRCPIVPVLCPTFPQFAAHFVTRIAAKAQPSLNVGRIERRREYNRVLVSRSVELHDRLAALILPMNLHLVALDFVSSTPKP